MTYNQVLTMANDLGADAMVYASNRKIFVTFNDFVGFNNNWTEIMRDYDDSNAVEAFKKMLYSNTVMIDDNFYTTYYFNDFEVEVGYASYDI